MIAGLAALLVANAALLLAARAVARRIATGLPSVDVLTFLLVRLALLSSVVLLAGMSRLLSPLPLAVAGAATGALLIARGEHRGIFRLRRFDAPPLLLALAAFVALRLLFDVWFFAPHVGDALAYHLPKVAEWVRAGGFVREMGLHPHVSFPAGFELIETWWVVFLRHDVLIEMAGLEFLVLAFASVHALARRVGLEDRWAFLAGLIYVLTPGLHWSALSCLNDAPVAALVTATAALAAWRAPASLLLMSVGMGVGIKATFAYALPGVCLLGYLMRRDDRPAWGRPAPAVALGAIGLGIGLFWFARNLVWYGNPVFPVGSAGYGADPVAVQVGPVLGSLGSNLADLFGVRVYDRQGASGANLMHSAGWGAVAFACGAAGILPSQHRGAGIGRLAVSFGLGLLSTLVCVIHDPWSLKYALFFPAVLAIGAANLARTIPETRLFVAAALLLNLASTFLPADLPPQRFRALAAQEWRLRSIWGTSEPQVQDGPIACLGGYTAPAYLLYGPSFDRSVRYLRSATADRMLQELRESGAVLLFASPRDDQQTAFLDQSVRTGSLTRLGGRLYRLP